MELDNYEVVRQEFVLGNEDIFLTFNRGKMYINSYGLKLFPEEDFVYVLIDEETKSIVLKPSKTKKRDNFKWSGGMKKRRPRHVGCVPLFYLVYRMMGWDINYRYRIVGEIENYNDKKVLFFDLNYAVCFKRFEEPFSTLKINSNLKMPGAWESHFGMPVMEYENRHDIKTYDDSAVFEVEFEMKERSKANE